MFGHKLHLIAAVDFGEELLANAPNMNPPPIEWDFRLGGGGFFATGSSELGVINYFWEETRRLLLDFG